MQGWRNIEAIRIHGLEIDHHSNMVGCTTCRSAGLRHPCGRQCPGYRRRRQKRSASATTTNSTSARPRPMPLPRRVMLTFLAIRRGRTLPGANTPLHVATLVQLLDVSEPYQSFRELFMGVFLRFPGLLWTGLVAVVFLAFAETADAQKGRPGGSARDTLIGRRSPDALSGPRTAIPDPPPREHVPPVSEAPSGNFGDMIPINRYGGMRIMSP